MKKMIAKFLCDKAVLDNREPKYQKSVDVELNAVQSTDNQEDQDFNKYTPSGNLTMFVDNPKAVGFFQTGKKYYLEFTPAPPEAGDEITVTSHGEHVHSGRVDRILDGRVYFKDGMLVSWTDSIEWDYVRHESGDIILPVVGDDIRVFFGKVEQYNGVVTKLSGNLIYLVSDKYGNVPFADLSKDNVTWLYKK